MDKDRQSAGFIEVSGLYCQLAWRIIDEATFKEVTDSDTLLDWEAFREIIITPQHADARTEGGEAYGARVGNASLVLNEKSVLRYLQQDLLVNEVVSLEAGQYILFSIDEFQNCESITIGTNDFDESELKLSADRYRFGGLFFDFIMMEYLGKRLCNRRDRAPYGSIAFALDRLGIVHEVPIDFS